VSLDIVLMEHSTSSNNAARGAAVDVDVRVLPSPNAAAASVVSPTPTTTRPVKNSSVSEIYHGRVSGVGGAGGGGRGGGESALKTSRSGGGGGGGGGGDGTTERGRSEMWKKAISAGAVSEALPSSSVLARAGGKPDTSQYQYQERRRPSFSSPGSAAAAPSRAPPVDASSVGAAVAAVAPVAPVAPVAEPAKTKKFSEKMVTTLTQAKKVGSVLIQSKILVSLLVFLCTALLLIFLNPPMAQQLDGDGRDGGGDVPPVPIRSWRKIMVWSSIAAIFALVLPYACGGTPRPALECA
jgi:hypothetical protein